MINIDDVTGKNIKKTIQGEHKFLIIYKDYELLATLYQDKQMHYWI